jgi:hypothetical protein
MDECLMSYESVPSVLARGAEAAGSSWAHHFDGGQSVIWLSWHMVTWGQSLHISLHRLDPGAFPL